MAQERKAAIGGIYEWPKRVDPGVSSMQIKAASIKAALDDAGLSWEDVDGLYDAGDGDGGGGLRAEGRRGVPDLLRLSFLLAVSGEGRR